MAPREKSPSEGSPPDFRELLLRLLADAGWGEDADLESPTAAARYEALRHRLIRYFTWERCPDPELLADEAFSRMARKIAEGESITSARGYLFGIARILRREAGTQQKKEAAALNEFAARSSATASMEDEKERTQAAECLSACLDNLSTEQREFILRYYQGDQSVRIGNRKQMAAEQGLDLNALRNRALRLRERLENCVRECLSKRERP